MADGSIHRPELKLFELKNGVQIPNLREVGHGVQSARELLTTDDFSSGAAFAVWSAGADRNHRGVRGQSRTAAAESEHGHAPPTAQRATTGPDVRAGARTRAPPLARAGRARGSDGARPAGAVRLRLASGGTALNKHSSRSHAMLTIKVRKPVPGATSGLCFSAEDAPVVCDVRASTISGLRLPACADCPGPQRTVKCGYDTRSGSPADARVHRRGEAGKGACHTARLRCAAGTGAHAR
jgi:hypothetical protein